LNVPVVLLLNALSPIAILPLVVFKQSESLPIAVLVFPDTLHNKEFTPIAVLDVPIVLFLKE
jgi:hypothetical protein